MPSSRLVDGRTADARIMRPVRVNLKKQKTTNTQTIETAITPMYCGEMATLPIVIGSIGNGLSRNWGNGVQIHAGDGVDDHEDARSSRSRPRCRPSVDSGRITRP